jgi:glucose/arabinose dehydrogenase
MMYKPLKQFIRPERMGKFMDAKLRILTASSLAVLIFVAISSLEAQNSSFHNAPASAKDLKNPDAGKSDAVKAGKSLYASTCASCHGASGQGTGSVPSLTKGPILSAKPGEVFWFITHGDVSAGMPAWESLPEQQRWQIVTYVKTLGSPGRKAAAVAANGEPSSAKLNAPAPVAPFTDFRFEEPGKVRKITPQDLPEPFATKSSGNGPKIVPRPEGAWPKVLPGFKVDLYAVGLDNPRLIRTAPNGDFFVAETEPGDIKVLRGISEAGKPQQTEVFASGLKAPFGIAFYPPGPNPQWLYIGNTAEVVRFPYENGDLKARGQPQHIADLPGGNGGHTTRDIRFTPDGKKMFVSVGSASNVDDSDTHPGEKNRADILEFNPDGSGQRIFAAGIRNPVGLAINPTTGELWCSVNERDALGDNLVPDYITHVQDGGFYGWPWWYTGAHQDPRHAGKHPELKDKVIVADVLLQPHNASLEITFYDGKQFPDEYQGDIFGAEHGSWNKATRAGYELIRVPLHQTGHASGEYEDFMTGFVLDNGDVWGRPVGVTVAPDGSLLVTDDGSNSIWHISYVGK